MSNLKIQETKSVNYEVNFGEKQEANRDRKVFSDESVALDFFNQKEKEGIHVDVYEVEVVTTTKKGS